jgi:hypothetical protein
VGNDGETLVADSSTSTGLRYQANFAAGKNKIINGDFGIWQRGTSFASGMSSQYTADRFFLERNSGTCSVTRQTFTPGTAPVAGYEGQYFFRVSPTVGGDIRVAQFIENVQTFAGQTVTFSFWAKASTATTIQYVLYSQNFGSGGSTQSNNTTGASQAITTSWARYSFTVTMDSIAGKTIGTSSYVRFALDLAETFTGDFDTWGWQLEAGSVATAFQTATGTIQGETSACQRYYWRVNAPTGIVGHMYKYLTGDGMGFIEFPVMMRVRPTSMDILNVQFQQTNLTNNAIIGPTLNADYSTNKIGAFTFGQTGLANGTQGYAAIASTGYVGFSAEL